MIWTRSISLDELNQRCQNTLIDHLGIKFSALTAETLEATMQVKSITHQPFGLLHGGCRLTHGLSDQITEGCDTACWLCRTR